MKRKIRAVSLFCGAGGLDLGFKNAGFDIVWANDFNRAACDTHRKNFPGTNVQCGSIMDFDYERDIPDCELVFGGPPCQGFSVAGKMDPNDPRSKLVFEFQKVVAAKRPRYFVMENVVALGRLEKFQSVRKALLDRYHELGYRKASVPPESPWRRTRSCVRRLTRGCFSMDSAVRLTWIVRARLCPHQWAETRRRSLTRSYLPIPLLRTGSQRRTGRCWKELILRTLTSLPALGASRFQKRLRFRVSPRVLNSVVRNAISTSRLAILFLRRSQNASPGR